MGFYNPTDWEKNMDKIKLSRIGENNVYWFFDSKADVNNKWEKFLAQKPDVVKILLLDAENPMQNFNVLKKINLRFKKGFFIKPK